jgi:hypothetical protein
MLTRRKESDIYLTTIRSHRRSAKMIMNCELSASTVAEELMKATVLA